MLGIARILFYVINNSTGKRPLRILHMRWEDVVKKYVVALGGSSDWKKRASDTNS